MELRASADMMMALGVTLIAVAMAVGYQLFRRRVAAGLAD
jgi:hypothetical protein